MIDVGLFLIIVGATAVLLVWEIVAMRRRRRNDQGMDSDE